MIKIEGTRGTIGLNIAKYRKLLKLSQQDLASLVGAKSLTTVSSWERGANAPDVDTIVKLCEVFKISIDELYGLPFTKWNANYSDSIKNDVPLYSYLESIGYAIKFEGSETLECATLTKEGNETVFDNEEFNQFKKNIQESVEYQLWQKNKST